MTTPTEDRITAWIMNHLSTPHAELSNMPACPYARSAVLRDTVYFWPAGTDDPDTALDSMARSMPGWSYNTVVIYWDLYPVADTVWRALDRFHELYPEMIAFYSDPRDWHKTIAGAKVAEPPCPIVNIHWRKDIDAVRPLLWMLGYYRNWTVSELEAIDYLQMSRKKT